MSADFSALMFSDASQLSLPFTGPWSALDDSLCNPNFVSLRRICFNVRLFVQTDAFQHHVQDDHLRAFVPKVYEHPLAKIETTFERTGGEDAFASWLFETQGKM